MFHELKDDFLQSLGVIFFFFYQFFCRCNQTLNFMFIFIIAFLCCPLLAGRHIWITLSSCIRVVVTLSYTLNGFSPNFHRFSLLWGVVLQFSLYFSLKSTYKMQLKRGAIYNMLLLLKHAIEIKQTVTGSLSINVEWYPF